MPGDTYIQLLELEHRRIGKTSFLQRIRFDLSGNPTMVLSKSRFPLVRNIEAHLIPLPLERSNRTAVPLRMADLTWSTIKTPALISEIRFRFGLSIDGDEMKNQRISRRPSIGRVFQ